MSEAKKQVTEGSRIWASLICLFAYCGSILGSSQLTLLPQLRLKMMLNLKVVKINSKIIILLHLSKFVTHSVEHYWLLHILFTI